MYPALQVVQEVAEGHCSQSVVHERQVVPERYFPAAQLRQVEAEEQVRQGLEQATAAELEPSSKKPSLGWQREVVALRKRLSEAAQSVQRPLEPQ